MATVWRTALSDGVRALTSRILLREVADGNPQGYSVAIRHATGRGVQGFHSEPWLAAGTLVARLPVPWGNERAQTCRSGCRLQG
jgi:hypothetical protein